MTLAAACFASEKITVAVKVLYDTDSWGFASKKITVARLTGKVLCDTEISVVCKLKKIP